MSAKDYVSTWRKAVCGQIDFRRRIRNILKDAYIFFKAKVSVAPKGKFLRCLYCHYVFDDQIDDFAKIIRHLKRIGKFVDTQTCIKMLNGERQIDDCYFHLSFDDGFKNNHTNAAPILKSNGVPAIFFVSSGLLNSDYERCKDFCQNKTNYSGIIEMMNWQDLLELKEQGFEIGSHTRTHANFSSISLDSKLLEEEILGSKLDLEKILGCNCDYIAWPYGKISDADSKSLEMVRQSGYKACFGAFRGSVLPKVTNPFMIPRHHFEAQWPIYKIDFFAKGNAEIQI